MFTCKAEGGKGTNLARITGGESASCSSNNKTSDKANRPWKGRSDFPGDAYVGGASDGSAFLNWYGGGVGGNVPQRNQKGGKGGDSGAGLSPSNNKEAGNGGYCGGDGGSRSGGRGHNPEGHP